MLISPSAHGMCCMLKLCDEYARDFNVVFNASKSKCTVNRPRGFALGYCVGDVHFSVRGHDREIVDNCPHLGHIISNDGNAKLDIAHRCCQFIGQFNHVLCWFGKLDSSSKTKLLKSYCSDFYGCELWDLANWEIQSLSISWRHALRRIWKLPYNCHTAILHILSGWLPMVDVLCKRVYNFIHAYRVRQ